MNPRRFGGANRPFRIEGTKHRGAENYGEEAGGRGTTGHPENGVLEPPNAMVPFMDHPLDGTRLEIEDTLSWREAPPRFTKVR
jgi:hypothetical protein